MAVFAGATRALARRPQSALRAARFVGQQAPGASARSATSLAARYVRIEASKIDTTETKAYPTPANGHSFRMNIFGLLFSDSEIMALQDCIWNGESFLPNAAAQPLPPDSGPLADLSEIAGRMSVTLGDGTSPGLLADNKLRQTVTDTLDFTHFAATMDLLQAFKTEQDPAQKILLGQRIRCEGRPCCQFLH